MWCLISHIDSRVLYIVLEGNNLTVGRTLDSQCGSFAVIEDASISRKHAVLSIVQNNLYLQDLGSRYGTFVNQTSEKIEVTTKVQLKHNDVVRFGKLNSMWTVQEVKHVTCTSTLKGENLQNLRNVLEKLGGSLKSDWDDSCTYLTMPAITLTIKVVLALVQGSYIVKTKYWNDVLNAISNNTKLPDPKSYTPTVIESTINKEDVVFLPDGRRRELFTGKKFIFFSRRQLEIYKVILLKSSATALLLSESKMTKSMLVSPEVVVIQYNIGNTTQESQAQRNQINDIINYLNSKGKRAVADAEIGLAILYCSTEKYCNPDFSFTSEVFKYPTTSHTKKPEILAQDTQETQKVQCKQENVMINESLTPRNMNTSNVLSSDTSTAKRKLTDEISENIMNSNKKVATAPIQPSVNTEGLKRKLNDEEALGNQNKKMAMDTSESNEDFFNFVNTTTETEKSTKSAEKKLNFFKPAKKAVDTAENEDDLFNFVEDTTKSSTMKQASIKKMFETRTQSNKETVENKENSSFSQNKSNNALKEEIDDDDLHSRMSDLDLGSTIVKVRRDLIVKKELLKLEEQVDDGENFKKFKKVWPVKMQVTIIPKTSMSIIRPEGFDSDEISILTAVVDE